MKYIRLLKTQRAEFLFSKLIEIINTDFKLNSENKVSAVSHKFGDAELLLSQCLFKKETVSDEKFRKATMYAVKLALLNGNFELEPFLKNCNEYISSLKKGKKNKYVAWTGISLRPNQPFPTTSLTVKGVKIFIGENLPKYLNDPLAIIYFT